MTVPRQVLPGTTYLLTRRCVGRIFLLRPSAITNAILRYLLARAARRTGILIHAVCAMSDHIHLVVTDPRACVPAFCQYLDGLVARALNFVLGRRGSFWDEDGTSAVILASPADIVAKAAYTLANPVAAGLVATAREWPGVWTAPEQIGGAPIAADRPAAFFRRRGPLPDRVELVLHPPPGFDSADAFRRALEAALEELERQARAEHATCLGAEQVLATPPSSRAVKEEPRRRLKPLFAARDPALRLALRQRIAAFRDAYRSAWCAFRAGMRDVVFPAGTYQMRVVHRACCEAPA